MANSQDKYEQLFFLHHSGLCKANALWEMMADSEADENMLSGNAVKQSNQAVSGDDNKTERLLRGHEAMNINHASSRTKQSQQQVSHNLDDVKLLQDLREYITKFTACDLVATATQAVIADGNPNAEVVIVGEAPGAEEDKQGLPFVGRAGKLLDQALQYIGLDRKQDVYITNVVPWRPPGNRTPTNHELELCMPLIHKHIVLCKAKYVILLGAIALRALTDCDQGIIRARGQWMDKDFSGRSVHLLATFHPAFLLRQPSRRKEFWQDFLSLQARLLTKN